MAWFRVNNNETFTVFYRLFVLKTTEKVENKRTTTKTYKEILEKKHKFFKKYGFLKPIYIFFVLFDYYLQFKFKNFRSRKGSYLIADRYFYDVFVNLAITIGWNYQQLTNFLRKMYLLFPYPNIRIFVDIDPEVAFKRKDDVISIEYLQIRSDFYRKIAKEFDFKRLDGKKRKEELLNKTIRYIDRYKGRIIYVHSNNRDVGGADFCLERMSNELRKKGFDTLVLLSKKTSITERYKMNGNSFVIGNFIRPQLNQGIFYYLFYLPWKAFISYVFFLRIFYLQKPDIVHVNDMYDFIPAFAAKTLRIPVVYHLRMIRSKESQLNRIIGKLICRLSDRIFAVSEATADAFLSLLSPETKQVAMKKLDVVRDWNDNERFCEDISAREKSSLRKSLGLSNEDFVIINVGRLEEWKGQHLIIEAIGKLLKENRINPNVKVLIVGGKVEGKEDYVVHLKRLIKEYELQDVVKLLGERKDVHKLLKISNLFVHTSILPDPFPGTVVEAMLSETPVLASSLGGVPEMIEDGETGFLFNPYDFEGFKDKLLHLIKNYDDVKNVSLKAREKIQMLTEKKFIVETIEGIYLQILEEKNEKRN